MNPSPQTPIPPPPVRGPSGELEQLRNALGDSAEMHASIVAAALDCIITVDATGVIHDWNPAAEQAFGYPRSLAIGAELSGLVVPERHRETHLRGFAALVEAGDGAILGSRFGVEAMRSDGSEFPCELTLARISQTPLMFAAFARDISRQRARENELAELARENELILNSAGDGILRLDRDGRIAYANPAAGELLELRPEYLIGEIAAELVHHTSEDGVALDPVQTPMMRAVAGGAVSRVTSEVFWRAGGGSFPVDYTMAPLHRDGAITGAVCVFADITEERRRLTALRERFELQGWIGRAIEQDRLLAYSQPIVCLETQEPAFEEMLVRVREQDTGRIVAAGEFLPDAERLGLVGAIDEWMIGQALARIAAGECVAVNLSAVTIGNDSLMSSLVEQIDSAEPPPGSLVIEITETAAIDDMRKTRALIDRLTRIGCPLAIDDFGTGFGSITYLRELQAHFVKIDMDFVRNVASSPSDRKIVSGIVGLARSLGQRTIAEGIETREAMEACRELGVDYGQGYLFGRPGPPA